VTPGWCKTDLTRGQGIYTAEEGKLLDFLNKDLISKYILFTKRCTHSNISMSFAK